MSIEDFGLEGINDGEGYDEDEDSLPTVHIVQRREVSVPNLASRLIIESQIGEDSVYIKVHAGVGGKTYFYCFMSVDEETEKDFLDPTLVLDTLEEKLRDGLLWQVAEYFDEHGRNITDPIEFHIGLRALSR